MTPIIRRTIAVVGICVTTLVASANATAQDARSEGEHGERDRCRPAAIARDWVAAWNSHDPNAVAAVFTPDAFYEDLPFGLRVHGTAEIHDFAQFFFTVVPDLNVEYVNSCIEEGHGTIEWIFSGTDQGIYSTGNRFSVRGVTVIDARRGRIARNSDYYDLATILRQLGLLPPGL